MTQHLVDGPVHRDGRERRHAEQAVPQVADRRIRDQPLQIDGCQGAEAAIDHADGAERGHHGAGPARRLG